MILIDFAGHKIECPDGTTVAELLEIEEVRNPEVALIQVNFVDVTPDHRDSTVLHSGDQVDVLYFLGDS